MNAAPRLLALLLLLSLAAFAPLPQGNRRLQGALKTAERHLSASRLEPARDAIESALERDRTYRPAWQLLARWAAAAERPGEQVRALHEDLRLAAVQGAKRAELKELQESLAELDPRSKRLFGMADDFRGKLVTMAKRYESDGRWHAALRVWKQVLALVPEDPDALQGMDRVTSQPDPSLAGDARSKDLLEGISAEWIAEHDVQHREWKEASREERDHYITKTDAGYEVMVRTAEAMEQVNAFYREFFQYGGAGDGRTVPRITVHIFKNRDEYLDLGQSPAEWSAGQFTGNHVETYVPTGGFESMVGVLFHEAAHQFVSIATGAVGWLNEGLASFFEGTRILANGSVIMNLPADHRLFPLVQRMAVGWMTPEEVAAMGENTPTPAKAPTFRIVLENRYTWGPPWYAPTWGVVFFLYNYQDPWDGRFIYRKALREFIDKSGGRMGDNAVKNFEEVVLANPEKRFDAKPPKEAQSASLPKTVEELNQVWMDWMVELQGRQALASEKRLPYLRWARFAQEAGHADWAAEHYEKGLLDNSDNLELLQSFAELLAQSDDTKDRATALMLRAVRIHERADPPDALAIARIERELRKLDPMRVTLTGLMDDLRREALELVVAYREDGQDEMVLDLGWRFGASLGSPELMGEYADAVRRVGGGLERWELAYNEEDLSGWSPGAQAFAADDQILRGRFGEVQLGNFDYSFLALDRVTSGDFSLEADVQVQTGKSSYAGFVFGQKTDQIFHGALLFPESNKEGVANSGYVDLMTSRGAGATQAWRHVPVQVSPERGSSSTGNWHKMRVDVVGSLVDVWYDGELVATHQFPSSQTLRGRFGLILGRGEADYRRVRFQLRDPRDPASKIEREVRLEQARAAGGGSIAGSYQGQVPPFPVAARWLQGEREEWSDRGAVPQVVVFMSRRQNSVLPLGGWLRSLEQRGRRYGLQVMVVLANEDASGAEDFLEEYPLPGSVAVDDRGAGQSTGLTFGKAFIERFNLPRLWLLDIDGRVVWEGDPGFTAGVPPAPPYPSYLDDPLNELVQKRRMPERFAWRDDWASYGREALALGDMKRVMPLLAMAASLEPAMEREVARAARIHQILQESFGQLEDFGALLEERGAPGAAHTLVDWAESFGISSKKAAKSLKGPLRSSQAKTWDKWLGLAERFPPSRGDKGKALAKLMEDLAKVEAPWCADLQEAVEFCALSEDYECAAEVLQGASDLPGAWLCREVLGLR